LAILNKQRAAGIREDEEAAQPHDDQQECDEEYLSWLGDDGVIGMTNLVARTLNAERDLYATPPPIPIARGSSFTTNPTSTPSERDGNLHS
jgi:hypothetical protein